MLGALFVILILFSINNKTVNAVGSELAKEGLYANWTIVQNSTSLADKSNKANICKSDSFLDPNDILDCPKFSMVANNTIYQAACGIGTPGSMRFQKIA